MILVSVVLCLAQDDLLEDPPSRHPRPKAPVSRASFIVGGGAIADDLYYPSIVSLRLGGAWAPTPMAELGVEADLLAPGGARLGDTEEAWGWSRMDDGEEWTVAKMSGTLRATVRVHLLELPMSPEWRAGLGLRGGGGFGMVDGVGSMSDDDSGIFPLLVCGGFVQIRRDRMELRFGVEREAWVQTTSSNPDARVDTHLSLDNVWWW